MSNRTVQHPIARMAALLFATWCSVGNAELYEYGTLRADVPSGWSAHPIALPGTTLIAFHEGADPNAAKAVLLWIEATPIEDVSPEAFTKAVVAGSGLKISDTRLARAVSDAYQLVIDGSLQDDPVTAAFYGLERNERLYIFALIAEPASFAELGGARLPIAAFNEGAELETMPRETPASSAVHARSGQYTLTQKKIESSLAFIEFLTVRDISVKDKETLRQQMIAEYSSLPEKELIAYDDVTVLMDKIPTLDRLRRAEVRRDLMNQIYFEAEKGDRELVDFVYRYNPVLGADDGLGLAVPRSAYDALLASNSFVATQAGLKPITAEQRETAANDLRRAFGSLSDKDKRYLNDAEVNWLKVIAAWPLWSEQERKKNLQLVGLGRVKSPQDVPQVARNLEHWAGIAVNNAQVMEMVGMQGQMMALAHLRGMLSEF